MSRPKTKAPIAAGSAYVNKQRTRNRFILSLAASTEPEGTPDYTSTREVTYVERNTSDTAYEADKKTCSMRSFYVWADSSVPTYANSPAVLQENATTAAA
jgi:hypothetical protein